MNTLIKSGLFICLLLLCACNSSSDSSSYSPMPEAEYADGSMDFSTRQSSERIAEESMDDNLQQEHDQSPQASGELTTEPAIEISSPKIIYTANLRMQVDSLQSSLDRIREMVTANGGYISDQSTANTRHERSANLVIRLPTAQLEGSLGSLRDLARFVDHERLNSEDVTDQWVDLESRLQTKRDVRDRYIEVLRRRAVKVEDILNAEERIRRITEEIEAQEGRLRYLRNKVSLSTLHLNLYETIEYVAAPSEIRYSFGNRLLRAFKNGWVAVGELLLNLISVWPLLLIVFPLGIWGYRRLFR